MLTSKETDRPARSSRKSATASVVGELGDLLLQAVLLFTLKLQFMAEGVHEVALGIGDAFQLLGSQGFMQQGVFRLKDIAVEA